VGLLLQRKAGFDFEAPELQTPVARRNYSPNSAVDSTHQAEEKQKSPSISLGAIRFQTTRNCKMSTFGEYFRVTTYVPI